MNSVGVGQDSLGNEDQPPVPPARTAGTEDFEGAMRMLSGVVNGIVGDLAGRLAQWPAVSMMALGILLIGLDFSIEVLNSQLSSTEYISTLITGAAMSAIGVVLEMNRSHRLGRVAETGTGHIGQVSEAMIAEMRGRLPISPKGGA